MHYLNKAYLHTKKSGFFVGYLGRYSFLHSYTFIHWMTNRFVVYNESAFVSGEANHLLLFRVRSGGHCIIAYTTGYFDIYNGLRTPEN